MLIGLSVFAILIAFFNVHLVVTLLIFHLRLMNTVDFNIHRHIHIVELASSYKSVCFADLYYVFPLHLR